MIYAVKIQYKYMFDFVTSLREEVQFYTREERDEYINRRKVFCPNNAAYYLVEYEEMQRLSNRKTNR